MKHCNRWRALVLLVCSLCGAFGHAAEIVFDPWNRVHNWATAKSMAEQVGLTAEQLMELKRTVDLTIQVLSQATWIHDAVTGKWDVEARVKEWVRRRLYFYIAVNVPVRYRDLVAAAIEGRIAEYFRNRRARYPVLRVPELDPWNPNSSLAHYYRDSQAAYDTSHAIAEQTYDDSAETLRNLEALQAQLPQKDVNSSMTLVGQILIENGVTFADWKRANAAHEKARAQELSRQIEARRQWMQFIGVEDPRVRYGYLPP